MTNNEKTTAGQSVGAKRVALGAAFVAGLVIFGCGGSGGIGGTAGGTSGGTTGGGSTGGNTGGSTGGTTGGSGGGSGGSSGGGIGDLNTDLVISRDTVINGEVRAKNLIIADGVKVSAPKDLVIQASGKVTLNGQIAPSGKLTLVPKDGMDVGARGRIEAGSGDIVIVSALADAPTETEMDATFAKNFGVGADKSQIHLRRTPSGRDLFGNPVHLPPIVWAPGATRRHLWVNILGTLDVGGAGGGGAPITYDLPDGAAGANRNGDNANAGDGKDGGSVALAADRIEVTGPVTFNLGSGGDGGTAVSGPTTSSKAVAKGGKGGNTGKFIMASAFLGILHGIDIQQTMTINFGHGGRGGDATATGLDGADGSPGKPGEDAKATGGAGGLGALPGSAGDDVNGLIHLVVNGQPGGDGGHATANGGKGGNDNACPGTSGGKGGKATAIGGKGGDSKTSLSGGTAGAMADGPGGNGGNATTNAGMGGNGADCCGDEPKKGGDGGNGGNAVATPGDPGEGQPLGAVGMAMGVAGDGGKGGDGLPPGKGGGRGVGTNVPDGADGVDGKACDDGDDDTDEDEPNDLIEEATFMPDLEEIGHEQIGMGSLFDVNDKDHFRIKLGPGAYQITVLEKPAQAELFFLDIGGGNGSTAPIGTPAFITIAEPMTPVWIGFFGGTGGYKFAVRRLE